MVPSVCTQMRPMARNFFGFYRCFHRSYRSKLVYSHVLSRQESARLPSSDFTCQKCDQRRWKSDDLISLFVPAPVKVSRNADDINVGEELTTKLNKEDVLRLTNQFFKRPEIKQLSQENGLDARLYHQTFISFRRYCLETDSLPVDLHIVFSDILQGAGHVDDLFPYFLQHAQQVFPHLSCMDDLKKISDLRLPANWYPEARAINRKIIFHSGPTNSGKTYHALERFITAKSGVYCGPLKLLAVEVHAKTNTGGTLCDLVTGEERQYANADKSPSGHVACTVEMTSVTTPYEVAIIDEIQMIKDPSRGWAWTRALLGIAAEEIHLCGEGSALDLVKEVCAQIGEEVEVRNYKRLTSLTIENEALETIENVRPGDCIVCFNKNDIYTVSRQIEKIGHSCAVIYGGLPPGTKLAQANKFNDPNDPCKIMVATDAIGMGLNLSIRRLIFYSIIKPTVNEKGEKEMDTISTSQALQIAGRAGRYGTQFSEGFVTTFKSSDLPTLKALMERKVEAIKTAGLHPTADQIELFAYHLPHATLSNLMDIFVSLCQVDDSRYFMCNVDDFKFLADMIQHVPLPLRARYVFCCAPINKRMPFVCTMFLKFARQYSKNEAITFDWLCRNIGWPFSAPATIVDLVHLEAVFDVLDLYLWLSYRFPDLFPDVDLLRDMQKELDAIIQMGVLQITLLLRNSESTIAHATEDEDSFVMRNRKKTFVKGKHRHLYEESVDSVEHIDDSLVGKASEIVKEAFIQGDDNRPDTASSESPSHLLRAHGRLTSRLINQGLLTPEMIKQLQQEWQSTNVDSEAKPRKQTRPRLKEKITTNTNEPVVSLKSLRSRKNKK